MKQKENRNELLAFVAEKYYKEDLKQTEIADMIGFTRSSVSRLLTEAKHKGIVEILIHHPFQVDEELERFLQDRLNLDYACVVKLNQTLRSDELKTLLGKATSLLLEDLIRPGIKIGISWGTTVQATIQETPASSLPGTQVVQLVGVLGSTRNNYSAQILVEQMAKKLGGDGIYLYAPFFVESEETASSLLKDHAVKQAISASRQCDIAIMGIGAVTLEHNSLYKGNYIQAQQIKYLDEIGAVGDACGIFFDINGQLVDVDLHKRRIGVSLSDLKHIRIKLGVAGSKEKAKAIIGAIRGGFINSLVTDKFTAERILELVQ